MVYLTLSENGHHSELKKTEPMISDPEQCGHRGRRMNAFVVNYEEKLGPSGVGDTVEGIQDAYMDLGLAGGCVAPCGGKIHDKCL